MRNRKKFIMYSFASIASLVGFYLISHFAGWHVALGVFALQWGTNMGNAADEL